MDSKLKFQLFIFQLVAEYSGAGKNGIWCVEIRDAGHTQIEADSLTTVGFCPMEYTHVPEVIINLKLM